MKKVLFSLGLLFCMTVAANAQDQMWIGGSLGVISVDSKDGDSSTAFTIMPEVGVDLGESLSIGILFGYAQSDVMLGTSPDKLKVWTLNPFVRYSFLKGGFGSLFVEGSVAYSMERFKTSDLEENVFSIGLRPGVNVNVSDNLSLIGRFGFFGYERETEAKVNTFTFGIDATDVSLGLVYKF